MEVSKNNKNPKPNPNTMPNPRTLNSNPQQRPYSKRAASKTVAYQGVWVKKSKQYETKKKAKVEERIRYGVEIQHHSITKHRRKIWLGTYDTPEEGALAYDLASIKIKGKAPNQTIGDNGEIIISMNQAKKDKIKSEVEKKISGHYGSGDGSKKSRTNTAGMKRVMPRVNKAAPKVRTRGKGVKLKRKEAKSEGTSKFPATRCED